jgi:hypothetical protein
LFIIGGFLKGDTISKCWVFHFLTNEVELITEMKYPRDSHTVYYQKLKAYVVGGDCGIYNFSPVKECLVFDVLN